MVFRLAGTLLWRPEDMLTCRQGGRLVDYMRGPGIHQFADEPGEMTLFEYAYGTKSIFGLLEKNPEQKESFDDYMKSRRLVDAPQWFDIYPASIKLANARKDPEAILLVDIAGGPGQEVEGFKQRNPTIPGRCFLQDLPLTLQRITKLHTGVEAMAYDFFTPQPLKGTYNINSHTWPTMAADNTLYQPLARIFSGTSYTTGQMPLAPKSC